MDKIKIIERDKEGFLSIHSNTFKITVLILAGFSIRIFMLIFYYIVHLDPSFNWGGWGDVSDNYVDVRTIFSGKWVWGADDIAYPPLTAFFLLFLNLASFNFFYIYVFYAFILEIIVSLLFYLVLKKFEIKNRNLVYGIYLLNPFYFLQYIFSPYNCGYHITDSFFCIFLLLALFYYPEENKSRFYFFMGLTMCAKWFTLPFFPLIILKYLMVKNWGELRKIFIYIGTPVLVFLILPVLFLPNYINLYTDWMFNTQTNDIAYALILNVAIFAFLPTAILFIFLLPVILSKLEKGDMLIIVFISIILMSVLIFFVNVFVRYLVPLIFYGHLKTKEEIFIIDLKKINIKFKVGNHLLTYLLSIFGCFIALLLVIFLI
jgi:hypothetical protein